MHLYDVPTLVRLHGTRLRPTSPLARSTSPVHARTSLMRRWSWVKRAQFLEPPSRFYRCVALLESTPIRESDRSIQTYNSFPYNQWPSLGLIAGRLYANNIYGTPTFSSQVYSGSSPGFVTTSQPMDLPPQQYCVVVCPAVALSNAS